MEHTEDENIEGKNILKNSLDKMDKAAILCCSKPSNIYYLEIIYYNNLFAFEFNLEKQDILGNNYDFLFESINTGYDSQDEIEQTRLLRSVKNSQAASVILKINSKDYRVVFSPNSFRSKYLYSIFSFDKITGSSNLEKETKSPKILIRNLERSLSKERLLRKVAEWIVTDSSVQEISEKISKAICDYLKIDRCIIHDCKSTYTSFIIEHNSNFVRRMVNDKDPGFSNKNDLIKYINFQTKLFSEVSGLKKLNTTLFYTDLVKEKQYDEIEEICQKFSIRSQISVSTVFNNKVNGAIYLHQSSPRKWMFEEIELLETISEQVAMAIGHSHAVDKIMVTNHNLVQKTMELKKALSEEKTMRKMQSEFVAVASHEFKTPLQIIDSSREILLRKLKDNPNEVIIKNLDKIKNGSVRMNNLIKSTLDLAQFELSNSKIAVNNENFNLKDFITEILDRNGNLSTDKNISVITDLDSVSDNYYGDKQKLDHCFTNVIINAIKYSSKESQIKIISKKEDEFIVIEIIDYGMGIPSEDIKNIGRKFFRASNTLSTPGTGIGIYLTNKFLGILGGSLKIKSKINEGSNFTIYLPDSKEI